MNRAAVIAVAGAGVIAVALLGRHALVNSNVGSQSAGPTGTGTAPRGIRNNNPGNLIYSPGITWNGQTGADSGGYLQFSSPEYGIRALALNLHNYQARDGLTTLAQIITRWAPPSSNNTSAYIQDVASRVNVNPSAAVNVDQIMVPLVEAIIEHENGEQPYSNAVIVAGIKAAGIPA